MTLLRDWLARTMLLGSFVVIACAPSLQGGASEHVELSADTLAARRAFVAQPLPPPTATRAELRLGDVEDQDVAAYLAQVSNQLRGPWRQFLEDCRLRLPADSALNDPSLAAVATWTILLTGNDRGTARDLVVTSSGNADFDRVVADVVRDAAPYARPAHASAALVGDDGAIHLRWTFARDRRQAGIATASVEPLRWPVARAVASLLSAGQITAAVSRLSAELAAHSEVDQSSTASAIFSAAIVDALQHGDTSQQRSVLTAFADRNPALLSDSVRAAIFALARDSMDISVRVAAIADLSVDQSNLAIATDILRETRTAAPALVATAALALYNFQSVVTSTVLPWLGDVGVAGDNGLIALSQIPAMSTNDAAAVEAALQAGSAASSPSRRAAACAAAARSAEISPTALALVRRELADAHAAVRTSCIAAIGAQYAMSSKANLESLVELVVAHLHDRDEEVRAAAVQTYALIMPSSQVGVLADASEHSARVRTAYFDANRRPASNGERVAMNGANAAIIRRGLGDTDVGVRTAATRLAAVSDEPAMRAAAAANAADPIAEVRAAAIAAIAAAGDVPWLLQLARDPAPAVRAEAIMAIAQHVGRRQAVGLCLSLFLDHDSVEDRRAVALAWLLTPA